MDTLINGTRVTLSHQLGVGGEATVFLHGKHAVKIFHPIPPGTPTAGRKVLQSVLDNKVRKLYEMLTLSLPPNVSQPEFLTYDPSNSKVVTGFGMKAAVGDDLLRLADKGERETRGISNEQVLTIFRNLYPTVSALHKSGIVIGDFNSSNGLFNKTDPYLIDSDSFQFGSWLCTAGHEDYLDPRFYGLDLTKSKVFDEASDWYSMLVMTFVSLLYVHPYGGTHKAFATQLRRAEGNYSVLRPDVKYPKAGTPFGILPDDFLHYCESVFDKRERGIMPSNLLDFRWTKCQCGLEHARNICPKCAVPGVVVQVTRFQGKCKATMIKETKGASAILSATVQGGKLKYLYREGTEVFRENGMRVGTLSQNDGAKFAILDRTTWVGMKATTLEQMSLTLLSIRDGVVGEDTSTSRLGNYPMFDTNETSLYRMNGDWLIQHSNHLRIGKALDGQTYFRVGEKIGFGFYRLGPLTMYFIFEPGKSGLMMVETLPPISGRLLDVSVVFAEKYILFNYTVEQRGRVTACLYLLREDGSIKSSLVGDPSSSKALLSVRGKMMMVAPGVVRILSATDDGLLSLDTQGPQIMEKTLFTDTAPFVESGAELLEGPNGTVYVITTKTIQQLSIG